MHFATRAIHASQPSDPSTGALIAPIYQTSTFEQESPGVNLGFDYSRTNNPTRARLEEVLAELEGVESLRGVRVRPRRRARHSSGVSEAARPGRGAARRVWRHLSAAASGLCGVRSRRSRRLIRPGSTRWPRRLPIGRGWCGSRRRPTLACWCRTFAPSRRSRMPGARWWWSTTPLPPRCFSNPSRSAPTSWCTASRNISPGIPI